MKRPPEPRWYFSLRSPYSWFAYQDLTERHPDVLDTVEWIPYWEPDEWSERMLSAMGLTLPVAEMSRAKNFYILQDTRRIARARGVRMTWPVDREPVWEISHLAYLVAVDHGLGRQYVDRVYSARWLEGKNICLPETIAEIAADLGIDPELAVAAPQDEQIRERGVRCLARAIEDGAFGVPFFVHGFDKFWGAERVDGFVAAVRGSAVKDVTGPAWQPPKPGQPDLVEVGSDRGHAGGCG
jgi:2-hydroxychromene-2-carboxylate isomerase